MGITSATLAIIVFAISEITNYNWKHDIVWLTLLHYQTLKDTRPLSK